MLARDSIVAICNYLAGPQNDVELDIPAYYLMYIFDENGFLEIPMLRSLYDEMFGQLATHSTGNKHSYIGPFENLSFLNNYALSVCKKMNLKRVSVLTLVDYNAVIERSNRSSDIMEDLIKQGNRIENQEHQEKKGGIFKKLF